ncbi:2-C-methyl-D-erythritol 4-phosphate cytidylyltransferase [Aestuariimicrobium sp. Y1814]|uniref:2-C-methyl-D-erythritol 4-phosphate cytidylyltransferase n=1 Tax=Aestuariimicrobium sp. Y1814 TaxID=3418742 RepID=UPI003DA6EFC2
MPSDDQFLPPDQGLPVVGVIVAAGSGVRLGGSVPKALRQVNGRSLVARSCDALVAGGCTDLVVVIADGLQPDFEAALGGVTVPVHYALGGDRRQDSVVNGLDVLARVPELEACRVVLVHDAARALVPPAVVATVISTVQAGAAAVIPVVPMIDSVRRDHVISGGHGSSIVDRSELRLVQTPQGFDRQVLLDSHARAVELALEVTDDAAVCEANGHDVVLVAGSRDALKITEPHDVLVAEAICREREPVR